MKILDVSITPNIISYYVQYNNRQDKLVQYVSETWKCVNKVNILKVTYKCISSKTVKTIKAWNPFEA